MPQSLEAQGAIGRLNSQTVTREILGARETTTPLAQPEMRILLHTTTDCKQLSDGRTETDRTREERRRQQEHKGALELARVQIRLGTRRSLGMVHVQRGIFLKQEGMRELGLESTTTTGCALGVQHLFTGKLHGQRWRLASASTRLLDKSYTLQSRGTPRP